MPGESPSGFVADAIQPLERTAGCVASSPTDVPGVMTHWHATLGIVVVGVALLFALIAGATAWLDRGGHAQIVRLRLGVQVLLVIQAVLGVVLYLTGNRPGEVLHLVYGVAILGVLPLATTFASDAPPRARSWVLAVAGLLILLLAWRLLSTG